MQTVLVCDDDQAILDSIEIYLKAEGYEVLKAENGNAALKLIADHDIHCMVLDIMMPGLDGLQTTLKIREQHKSFPIIMLSAKSEDTDKIAGLGFGADDYVTKPFNPLEVMARVKSLLRRAEHNVKNNEPDQIEIGPLIIKKDSHEVKTLEGKEIKLTALEFGILHLLASHPNRVFSADEIFERVWQQESVVSAKTVMVHVSHLRDKIEDATNGEQVIQTVWGVGYKIESH